MTTQDLESQAVSQYEDLRDTILVIEAMKMDTKSPIEWNDLKTELNV